MNFYSLKIFFLSLFFGFSLSVNAQFGASPWTAPNGTYAVPAGVTSIQIECWGGGGGGGGAKQSGCSQAGGSGGGGGAYSITTVAVTPGQNIVVTNGTGGGAGSNAPGNGGSGTASTVTYLGPTVASAAGGSGGGGDSGGGVAPVGNGGTTGTGTIHSGGNGDQGIYSTAGGGGGGGSGGTTANGSNGNQITGGNGGATGGGKGGNGGTTATDPGTAVGIAGTAPGGGGGGGYARNTGCTGASNATTGGAGAAGKVIITYVVISNTITTSAISGSPFCAGAAVSVPFTISGTFNAGNVFTAQLSDAAGSFSAPTSIGTLTQTTAGTISATIPSGTVTGTGYRIRVIGSNPSTTGSDNGTNLTINALPAITGTTPASRCGTGTVALGATASTGTINWYTALTGGVSQGTGTSFTTPSISSSTTYYADATSAAGCTSTPRTSVLATINSVPAVVTVSGAGSFCGNTTITASGGAGGTIYWQNTTSGGTSTASTTNPQTISSSGTYYFRSYSGSCWGVEGSAAVTINPLPSINLGAAPAICKGNTAASLSYSSPANSPNQYSIVYDATAHGQGFVDVTLATLPASPITLTVPAGANAGNYNGTITVTNSTTGCTSSSTAFNVIVNAAPSISVQPSTTGQSGCVGFSATAYSVTSSGAGLTYQWYSNTVNSNSGGSLISGANSSSYTPSTSTAGTLYYYCIVSGTCTSPAVSNVSGAVTVFALPVSGALTPTPATGAVCTGTNVSATATAGSGGTGTITDVLQYRYDGGSWAAYTSGNSLTTTGHTSVDIQTYRTATGTGCTTSSAVTDSWTINTVLSAPTSNAASSITCTSFIANWSTVAGASTYYLDVNTNSTFTGTWIVNNSNVGNVTSYSVTGLTASTAYWYRVRVGNSCGTSGNSGSQTLTTSVPTPATPGAISGTASQCPSLTGQVYSVSAVTNATTYNWTVPTGWTITSGAGTTAITVTTGSTGQNGNITVTAGNACGTSAASSLAVTVLSSSASSCTGSTGIRSFGYSTAGYADIGYGLVQQTDGNYVITGLCTGIASASGDAYTLNISSDTVISWQRGVGSNNGGVESLSRSIAKTSDGGYVIAGESEPSFPSSTGTIEAYIVKLNNSGTPVWARTLDGNSGDPSGGNSDGAYSVVATNDGGYAMAGYTTQYDPVSTQTYDEFYLAKVDANGNYLWSHYYGLGPHAQNCTSCAIEDGESIVQNADGSFLMVGFAIGGDQVNGGQDILLVSISSTGAMNWTRTIGGAADEDGSSVIRTSDGKYVVVGYTKSSGQGGADMYIAKLSANGTSIDWQHTIGGASTDIATSVVESADGGYVVAGYTKSFTYAANGDGNANKTGADYDLYFAKFDVNGNLLWTSIVDEGDNEYANGIIQAADGAFAFTGYRKNNPNSDIIFGRINSSGLMSSACSNTTGGTVGTPAFANTSRTTNNAGAISVSGNQSTNILGDNNSSGGSKLSSLCGTLTPLPVELLSLSAILCDKKNCTNISWQTATEQNCDYFATERSIDGKSWVEIGKVKGAGNSNTTRNYDFTDDELPLAAETIYYRLKQTDFNGQFEYYGPIAVKLSSDNNWNLIIQNPATEVLQGTLFASESENSLIEIYDLQGRIIHSEKMNVLKGSNLFNMSINNIGSGVYFISILNSKTKIQSRFIKLK